MLTTPPQTWVYLYRSYIRADRIGFSKISSALLELTDSTVRCTLTSKAGYSRWLETRLHVPDLKERLSVGEHVTVFDFLYNGYRISWPTFFGGTVFQISRGDAPGWIVGVLPPRGRAGVRGMVRFFSEVDVRKQWRQALDPTGQHVENSRQRPYAAFAAPQQRPPSTLPPPG